MIIGINGKIGVGKDTVGTIIQGLLLTNKNQSSEIKKFAGKLKQIASILTGIPVENFEDQEFKKQQMSAEWGMTTREFLQKLGTEAMRDGLHTNVWCNALFADYKRPSHWEDRFYDEVNKKGLAGREEVWGDYPNWIITDMRFPNEMKAVVEKGGLTIKVVRPTVYATPKDNSEYNNQELAMFNHPSETALDDAEFDYEIINNGTMEELVKKVREILVLEELI